MAIEVCTEISNYTGISPRISFSHDLKNSNDVVSVEEDRHRRSDLRLLDSTASDFVFSITNNDFPQQFSSADELFSNGKIVPMQIKKVISKSNSTQQQKQQLLRTPQKKRLKEFLTDETDNEEEKPSSKYFWQFKRSSSLNFDTTTPNLKETELVRETQKQRLQKQSSASSSRRSSSSSSTSSTYYFYSSSLKKNSGSSSSGVRIRPVLNLPQAYIPKVTARFFGFGSLFCNGKIKRKKK
ncbi:uncharacterized protein [Cicer arietinum]|uniref:uncharacterized protein n=1 Tax=Cicer arietinum TaxID=3827 RepID=UPI003CC6C9F3